MPSTSSVASVSAATNAAKSALPSGSISNQTDGVSYGGKKTNGVNQTAVANGLPSHSDIAPSLPVQQYSVRTQHQTDIKAASGQSLGIHEHGMSSEQFVTALESYLRIQQNGRSPLRNYAAEIVSHGLVIPRLATAVSIAAGLGGLDVNLVYHIAEFAYNDFTRTVGALMQFNRATTCTVHDAYETALADIIRIQLARKVPDYATRGYLALTSAGDVGASNSTTRLPRIYISETSMWKHTYRHLCQETGLPEASFEIIPAVKGRMNAFALQAIIEKDQRSNNIPLVIVAVAGNNETGASDPLPKCLDIGRRYGVWLHAEGMSIPMMCLLPPASPLQNHSSANSTVVAKIADSITVDFAHWLGKFGLPKVTFIDMAKDAPHGITQMDQSFFYQRHAGQKIRLLPLWALLCLEGTDLLYKRSRSILELAFKLQKCILQIRTCKLLSPVKFGGGASTSATIVAASPAPSIPSAGSASSPSSVSTPPAVAGGASGSGGAGLALLSFDDVLAKASTGNVLLELLNPLVVFRFQMPPMEEREELIDALNVWLCTMLNREGVIGCDATTIPGHGVCLHFSPYDSLRNNVHYSNADVDLFVDRLTNFVVSFAVNFGDSAGNNLYAAKPVSLFPLQQSILQYTFINRSYFRQLTEGKNKSDGGSLQYVPVPYWPGLGAVRYIPKLWRSVSNFGNADDAGSDGDLGGGGDNFALSEYIPETARPEINKFNQLLLDKLKERDTAYSKGEDAGTGLVFIRFGMVDETTRIEDLVSNVRREGMKVEESREFHDSVAELIRKGIAAAQQDLKRESEDKLKEEGLLRQVPVFGSFVNWWYPMPKSVSGVNSSAAANPAATTSAINGRSFNLAAGTMEKIQFISSKSIVDYANNTAATGNSMGVHEHVVVSRQVSIMPSSSSETQKKPARGAVDGRRNSGSSSTTVTYDSSLVGSASNSPLPQTGPDDVQYDPRRVSVPSSNSSAAGVPTVQWPGSVKKLSRGGE